MHCTDCKSHLSHGETGLVKLLGQTVVVLVQGIAQQVVGQVEEGEAREGAENVDYF